MTLSCCSHTFIDWQPLRNHIGSHPIHMDCRRCRRGFLTPAAFKQHMQSSRSHMQGQTISRGQTMILANHESVGRDRSLPSAQLAPANQPLTSFDYSGIPTAVIKPIFKAACALRYYNPTVGDLVRSTISTLDEQILGSILEGALRLLPPDESPKGLTDRKSLFRYRGSSLDPLTRSSRRNAFAALLKLPHLTSSN